jgi:hypothetical protein
VPAFAKETKRLLQKRSYNNAEKFNYYQERQNRLLTAEEMINKVKSFKDIQGYIDKE